MSLQTSSETDWCRNIQTETIRLGESVSDTVGQHIG